MPTEILKGTLYKIQELNIGYDTEGNYLSMNFGHAQTCVLCISKERPISIGDLSLSEMDLRHLFLGNTLEFKEQGYRLQGIPQAQLAISKFRNFRVDPPEYIQVWSMTSSAKGITLYVPENPMEQTKIFPVYYKVDRSPSGICIHLNTTSGYQDGDLRYQADGRLPIPIPKSWLEREIPIRNGGNSVQVVCTSQNQGRYIEKRVPVDESRL